MFRVLLGAALIAASASAITSHASESGAYVAGSFGVSKADLDEYIPSGFGISVDDTSPWVGAKGGVYLALGSNFSLSGEVGITYIGTYTLKGPAASVDATLAAAEYAAMVGFRPVKNIELYGRAGFAVWRASVDYAGTESGVDPLYGFGVLLGSGPTRVRAGADFYDIDGVKIRALNAGVQHHF